MSYYKWTAEALLVLVTRRAEGRSYSLIARELGCTDSVAQHKGREMRLPLTHPNRVFGRDKRSARRRLAQKKDQSKPKSNKPDTVALRKCLRCQVEFKSKWIGNRLCQACGPKVVELNGTVPGLR